MRDGAVSEGETALVVEPHHAEACRTESCQVWNDLQVAIEVKTGLGDSWHVLYPGSKLEREHPHGLQIWVRLRDAPEIGGTTTVQTGGWRVPLDFGDVFRDASDQFIREEEEAAAAEARLRNARQEEIQYLLNSTVRHAIHRRRRCFVLFGALLVTACLVFMIFCTFLAFSSTEHQLLQAMGLSLAWLVLCLCACFGLAVGYAAFPGDGDESEVREAVRKARPELQSFEKDGGERPPEEVLALLAGVVCISFCGFGCLIAMTVAHGLAGLAVAVLALWSGVALLICCHCCFLCRVDNPNVCNFMALCPLMCSLALRTLFKVHQPTNWSLEKAVDTTHQRTIVFEGNVIAGCHTVSSWPGKYERAWDALVAGSRDYGAISAAVVFLPEGSRDFGQHDSIPIRADLRDLKGTCWCTALYGERKPWGCRWWTRWIANVERAVELGCTLEVYYFNGKKGRGKVKDFSTAGIEHKRREEIANKMASFQETQGFKDALDAGLRSLSKEKGPDTSSPYSREVQRLFLAWLPEDEGKFLEESEGLGNSQKAEVAWLDRKGYAYVEKEVSHLAASSPKAIGWLFEGP